MARDKSISLASLHIQSDDTYFSLNIPKALLGLSSMLFCSYLCLCYPQKKSASVEGVVLSL